jgi:hypothetical protein
MSGEKCAQIGCADTTIEDVRRWARELAAVHERIAPRFAHELRNEIVEELMPLW